MDVLFPAIMLGGLGIIFGLMLAFAAKKFAVKIDDRVSRVREHLSGANCGACGYPGCDGYAAAVVAGKAPCDLCRPAGSGAAKEIGKIMGVEVPDSEPYKAYPRCNGSIGNTKETFDYDGIQTCAAANLFAGGFKSCRFACLGLGDCVKACQFDAIHIKDGIPTVDVDKCVGCGACAKACPKNVISVIPAELPVVLSCRNADLGKNVRDVCTRGCISCHKCERTCEHGAITFENNLPSFNMEKCVKCGKCADACPTKCITKFPEYCVEEKNAQ